MLSLKYEHVDCRKSGSGGCRKPEALAERASAGNEWHVTGPVAPHGRYMSKSAELTQR